MEILQTGETKKEEEKEAEEAGKLIQFRMSF
jgi:hypothetical protein